MKKYFYANDIEHLLRTVEFILAKDYYKEDTKLSFNLREPGVIVIICKKHNSIERVLYHRVYLVDFIEGNSINVITDRLYWDLYFYHDTNIIVDDLGDGK